MVVVAYAYHESSADTVCTNGLGREHEIGMLLEEGVDVTRPELDIDCNIRTTSLTQRYGCQEQRRNIHSEAGQPTATPQNHPLSDRTSSSAP